MKIQVQPQEMVAQISRCQRAISARSTMPILQNIRCEAKENSLTLFASDTELTVQTSMPCQVEEEGVFLLPSIMIGNIFRRLPDSPALLETIGQRLEIRCFDSFFKLNLASEKEFPQMPALEASQATVLDNGLLIRAVTETEFATSTDESKPSLTGIFWERRKDQVRLVSLDGYRLALRKIAMPEESASQEESMVIPKRALSEYARMIAEEGKTSISQDNGHVLLESGSLKLYSRLIDKNFLHYEEILSHSFRCRVEIDRQAFQDALERASLLTQTERAHLIKLTFADQELLIESNSEQGLVHERIPIQKEGEDLVIAFNARYLLEGVRALESEKLLLYLNGMLNPMVVHPKEDEDSYLYLVLPVRIAGE